MKKVSSVLSELLDIKFFSDKLIVTIKYSFHYGCGIT